MKKLLVITVVAIVSVLGYGCKQARPIEQSRLHENGLYRGVFIDEDSIQINVEFRLENGIVTEASFRHLRRDENYNLEAEVEPYRSVVQQYHETLQYLVGKDLATHLPHLYQPENIVTTEVDGYTAATLRSNKVLSAIRDGLNRGVYSY